MQTIQRLVVVSRAYAQVYVNLINGSSSGDYGLIHLQPLGGLTNKGIKTGLKMGCVDLHKLLSHRGIPNCVDSQFEVPSDLNIPLWEHLLPGNKNHQLIYFP